MTEFSEQPKQPNLIIPPVKEYFQKPIPDTLQPREIGLKPWFELLSTLKLPNTVSLNQLKVDITIAYILNLAARGDMNHLTNLKDPNSTSLNPNRILALFTLLNLYPVGIPQKNKIITLLFTPEEDTEKMLAAIRNIPGINISNEDELLNYLTQAPFELTHNVPGGNYLRRLTSNNPNENVPNDQLVELLNNLVNPQKQQPENQQQNF